MCSQANADRQTDRWVFGTRVTDWEHMYNGWRNQRQYILYVCISVGFFLLSRLTSEFKSAPTKMRHAQSRFQASFSSQYLLVLMTANSGREWHIVALTVQRHFRYMRHRIKTKSTPATPPRNPSTCFLPSCKCTQALVTSTICVSWWIIQELAAVCSVGEHAKRNQSARSLQERHRLSRNAVFIMSCRLAAADEKVCVGEVRWSSDAEKKLNCTEPWWMAWKRECWEMYFGSGKSHFLQRQFRAALDSIKRTKCNQRCRRSL